MKIEGSISWAAFWLALGIALAGSDEFVRWFV